MPKLQIRLMIVLSILLACIITFDATFFYGMTVSISQLDTQIQTLKNPEIPQNMNGKTIMYFSDLQYGAYTDTKRVKQVFQEIKSYHPDILIFGGDLYDTDTKINKKNQAMLVSLFQSIEAPLGKYAVWGEKDLVNKDQIAKLYKKAQIEVLDNSHVSLSNQSRNSMRLVGLTNTDGIKTATENISNKTYNLLVTHEPDNLVDEQLSTKSINYALAGHAHSTQITYPFLGGYRKEKGAKELNTAKNKNLAFPYTLTTGVGCTRVHIRYNAKPEMHYFILKSK